MTDRDLSFMLEVAELLKPLYSGQVVDAVNGWMADSRPQPSYQDFKRLRVHWLALKEVADILPDLGIDECSVIEFRKILMDNRWLQLIPANY